MNDIRLEIVKDINPIEPNIYDDAIDCYISLAKKNEFVVSIYKMGSVNHPGISDIDLVVVVKNTCDPVSIRKLAIGNSDLATGYKKLFLHDIYLHTEDSFRKIAFSTYCDKLQLCYGVDLKPDLLIPEEDEILANQVIFDFIASRLAQFQGYLLSRKISYRGLLVRVGSIKHSYSLLGKLNVKDKNIEKFIDKVMSFRSEYQSKNENEVLSLFLDSFQIFSKIVEHAAVNFREKYLHFFSNYDRSNNLKLNQNFNLYFADRSTDYYRSPRIETSIYYPLEVFYHYLSYTLSKTPFAKLANSRLSFSGDEVFNIDNLYLKILEKRLHSITEHMNFLQAAQANFSMKGNPGFTTRLPEEFISKNYNICWCAASNSTAYDNCNIKKNKPLIDEIATSISSNKIKKESEIDFEIKRYDIGEYTEWVNSYFPEWKQRYKDKYHKKLIELFVTYNILEINKNDIYLDAAGGYNTYADRLNCKHSYLHLYQLNEQLFRRYKDKVKFLEGDASKISLGKHSVSKISCHHSFEHFQKNSDIEFIIEVQRLLIPGGKCCIVPIFISDNYVEVTRKGSNHLHFDKQSRFVVDPQARITGGDSCGDYARIYSLQSFKDRISKHIDLKRFTVQLSQIELDGKRVPDLELNCHLGISKINHPYRALTITHHA